MIELSRNLKIFGILLIVYTLVFHYFLSSLLNDRLYDLVWYPAGAYGVAIFITAWILGSRDPIRKSRVYLAFRYNLVTYCITNGIWLLWTITGLAAKTEALSNVLITMAVWGFFLIIHFHYSRKSIKGIARERIFD